MNPNQITPGQMMDWIFWAQRNQQPCPFCNTPCSKLDCDAHGNTYFIHQCDCLTNLQMATYEPDPDIDDDDWLLEQSNEYNAHGNVNFDECPYDPVEAPTIFEKLIEPYEKYCHFCKEADGVDSSLPQCTPDPPYKYKCKYCGHSLRTHKLYGEGRPLDMGNFGNTWASGPNGRKIQLKPS
ncbi:MAG: hypothetical protein ABIL58_03570 [Pseudomonadota bacterium]